MQLMTIFLYGCGENESLVHGQKEIANHKLILPIDSKLSFSAVDVLSPVTGQRTRYEANEDEMRSVLKSLMPFTTDTTDPRDAYAYVLSFQSGRSPKLIYVLVKNDIMLFWLEGDVTVYRRNQSSDFIRAVSVIVDGARKPDHPSVTH
jgi:hypothetical protein